MQFNSVLDNLKTYEAGKPIELVVREYGIEPKDVIKLASNENPRGCSPKVIEAVRAEATKMNLYPDDSMYELKEALSQKYNVEDKNIIIGSGSDQVIELAIHAKANSHTKVLMAGITFAMYEIYTLQTGATVLRTPSSQHNLKEMLEIYQANKDISVIFLCVPNNPLGECLDAKDVYAFLDQIDKETLVVIDAAYLEYGAFKDPAKKIDPRDVISKYPNTIYTGTFSKAYGLGGMRCGYGIAQPEIIQVLLKLRAPFNITTLTLKAAIVALSDQAFVDASVKENFEQMKRYEQFAKELGFKTIESYTNFIVLEFDASKNSGEIAQKLMEKGIIVRNLGSYGMNAIRITIGTPEQNSRFFELFTTIYK
ncbi:MAG: histidinol-phosphate transaminase [Sulfurospirillaceae bacterium]|jgi:histidinol-phosphate aminotransferase|nr:histidinol-phosphate transaminase [Sulfurospirillaceae bacterium]MDD2825520.1 histidinol-phosphate transaminase [Sulfurospirillaceae bacterium]